MLSGPAGGLALGKSTLDLEKKTFLIILATLTVVAGLAAVIADRLVLESFRDLERDAAADDLDRMREALAADLADLGLAAQDWAHWDDAYAFVQGTNAGFVASNVVPQSFAANRVSVMVFLDADDSVVFAAAFQDGTLATAPPRLADLDAGDPLLSHADDSTPVSGLLQVDGRTYLVSSWPILTSLEQGPAAGTLVWARELDVAALGAATRLDLHVRPWQSSDTEALADGGEVAIQSRTSMTVQARMDDLSGAPPHVLEARLGRPIYQQGLNTMAYVFASAILIGGGLLVAMIVLLNTTILSRLKRLTQRIEVLGGDPHGRVEVAGADEITQLAVEFNRLLDRLDRHQARLEASNADLRHFAAVVSHDLQPPLSTVALNAAVLREHNRGKLDPDTLERLARIESTALRMAGHIRAILDYSRVTYEAPGFERVDLTASMAEVVSHLEERLQATQGRIEHTSLPAIDANPTQMMQLLQNLVGNGLKFHRAGVPPHVKVTAQAIEAGRIRLTVEDNGEGFDVAAFERMRKPYIRLPGRGAAGHGLGLATADKIVERHRGRLWAESTPGQGSRIHVELPVRQGRGT